MFISNPKLLIFRRNMTVTQQILQTEEVWSARDSLITQASQKGHSAPYTYMFPHGVLHVPVVQFLPVDPLHVHLVARGVL